MRSSDRPTAFRPGILIALVVVLLVLLLTGCANGGDASQPRSAALDEQPALVQQPRSGLPTIPYQDLPPEAWDTIALIEAGGPFPFSRDGITFQNREGLLPRQPEGYYQEYTVITPGETDRGARRIVAGADGELYYTDDHYESFREVVP